MSSGVFALQERMITEMNLKLIKGEVKSTKNLHPEGSAGSRY